MPVTSHVVSEGLVRASSTVVVTTLRRAKNIAAYSITMPVGDGLMAVDAQLTSSGHTDVTSRLSCPVARQLAWADRAYLDQPLNERDLKETRIAAHVKDRADRARARPSTGSSAISPTHHSAVGPSRTNVSVHAVEPQHADIAFVPAILRQRLEHRALGHRAGVDVQADGD